MTPRRGGDMSGQMPEKTIGWLWGFFWGAGVVGIPVLVFWMLGKL